jgi:hypothetical protein
LFLIEGCSDPTEPFQCIGSDMCISLQFVCDGQENDCPDNSDEDEALCTALRRPPKDTIKRFILSQYKNYGLKYIEFLFGTRQAILFTHGPMLDSIDNLASALLVSPTIHEFSKNLEMSPTDEKRLRDVFECIQNGDYDDLPKFIQDSLNEGLATLIEQLIRTRFLD